MALTNLKKDFSASLVVFLVALPLCIGISMSSGGTPIQGIMAGVIGGIVVGLLSGSNVSVSGPAAGLISIVAVAIGELGIAHKGQAFEYFAMALLLAGLIQIVLGALKAGFIGDFIPVSVIKGMLAAIGIILILKEIPHILGYDHDLEGEMEFNQADGHNTFSEIVYSLKQITPLAVIIGVLGLAVQRIWEVPQIKGRVWAQSIPPALLAVIFGIVINVLAPIEGFFSKITDPEHMVRVPVLSSSGDLWESLNGLIGEFHFPQFKGIFDAGIWYYAFLIAVIASIESLLSLEAGDKIDPQKRTSPANRELFAQGVGNTLAGLIGAMPITAVIVRTSANVNSGSKTKLSAIFHGIWLLLFVLLAPGLMNLIPKSALAAILIFVGYKLAKPSLFKDQFQKGWNNFLPFIATVIAIVFTNLLLGVIIGLVLGYFFILRSNYHKAFSIVKYQDATMLRFHHQTTFLNKSILKKHLNNVHPGESLILDFSNCTFMDSDIAEVVNDFKTHASYSNINLEFKFQNESQKEKFNLKFNEL